MQLFITNNFTKNNAQITVSDERVVKQISKVLRAKKGYEFELQDSFFYDENLAGKSTDIIRYRLSFESADKTTIVASVLEERKQTVKLNKGGIIISFLNKYDKIELIVQKLSELGIQRIIFVKTKRSVINDINSKKVDRFHKIALEAVEQSKNFILPSLEIETDITTLLSNKKILLFDLGGNRPGLNESVNDEFAFIGPEGGFDKSDYEIIAPRVVKRLGLGESVLRAETAAIVGGWIMQHLRAN